MLLEGIFREKYRKTHTLYKTQSTYEVALWKSTKILKQATDDISDDGFRFLWNALVTFLKAKINWFLRKQIFISNNLFDLSDHFW